MNKKNILVVRACSRIAQYISFSRMICDILLDRLASLLIVRNNACAFKRSYLSWGSARETQHSMTKKKEFVLLLLSLCATYSRKYHKSHMLTPRISMAYFARRSKDKLSVNKWNYACLAITRLMLFLMNRCNSCKLGKIFFTLWYATSIAPSIFTQKFIIRDEKNVKN